MKDESKCHPRKHTKRHEKSQVFIRGFSCPFVDQFLFILHPSSFILAVYCFMTQSIRIGILTVSDRASRGVYQDLGGPAIRDCLTEILASPWEPVPRIIPDERPLIEETLKELCDRDRCCLVVTTGGTGPARRDLTPEATAAVCDKLLDGFGEQMRAISLKFVPTAILSRQIAGIRGNSLIVNLPGKPSAIRDCLLAVFPAIPYCIDLIEGPYLTTHESVVKAFRPKSEVSKQAPVISDQK
jgi:molybdopterin adenylyltransferase